MNAITWADAMVRFAEDRLIVGREFAALFAGIGIEPSEKFTPDQIIESMDLDVIPLTAAKLAAKADGTRSENDWIFDALKLIDWVRDHHLLPWSQGQPLPIEMRRAAVGMIRNKMMEPLAPIVNRPITLAELYAAGGFDEQGATNLDAAGAVTRRPTGGNASSMGSSPPRRCAGDCSFTIQLMVPPERPTIPGGAS